MTTHPPHHPTTPQSASGGDTAAGDDDRPLVDLIAGDPPVPITVWRTARAGGDRGATMPARLARRLVAAYSRPGEAVVDLTGDHALTTACRAGGRDHYRAWFTDIASLIIGPASGDEPHDVGSDPGADDEADTDLPPAHGIRPARATRAGHDTDPATGGRAAAAMSPADWFGNDLTDPQLPPRGQPVVPVPDGAALTGLTSLVVATWPLDPNPADSRVRLAWLLTACRELLRPGGCLVLVVAMPVGHTAAPEDFTPIVTAATQSGLGYLQHIVAVAADITSGEAFSYHLDDEELLTLSRARAAAAGGTWTAAHLRVHADLLVFTPAAAPPPPVRRRGSQDRRDRGDTRPDGGEHRG